MCTTAKLEATLLIASMYDNMNPCLQEDDIPGKQYDCDDDNIDESWDCPTNTTNDYILLQEETSYDMITVYANKIHPGTRQSADDC